MPLDVTFPANGSELVSAGMRAQFDEIKKRSCVNFYDFLSSAADRDACRAGTNTDDLTSLFHTARDQINASGGGTLFVPKGKYFVNLLWQDNAQYGPSANIAGDYGATVFESYAAGKFAITCQFTGAPSTTLHMVRAFIRDISIIGVGKTKAGILIDNGVGIDLFNVATYGCSVGVWRSATFYGSIILQKCRDCGVGMMLGTASALELIDTEDDSTIVDITLDIAPGTGVHSGGLLVSVPYINSCDIGILADNATPNGTPRLKINEGSIEGNRIGLCAPPLNAGDDTIDPLGTIYGGDVVIDDVWFEGNGMTIPAWSRQAPIKFNGVPMPSGDASLHAGRFKFIDCPLFFYHQSHGAHVLMDNCVISEGGTFNTFYEAPTNDYTDITGSYFEGDVPALIEKPRVSTYGTSKSASCLIPFKQVGAAFPNNLIFSEDFSGGSLPTTYVSAYGTAGASFTTGGVIHDNVLRIAPDQYAGLLIDTGYSFPDATEVFVLLLNAYAETNDVNFLVQKFGGGVNSSITSQTKIRAGGWQTHAMQWQPGGTGYDDDFYLRSESATNEAVRISEIALLRFASREAAGRFCAQPFWPA